MNAFISKGVTMPAPDQMTIYYNREPLRSLISTDIPQSERTQQADELLKSISHEKEVDNTWNRFRLNPLYTFDYVLYGNFGKIGNSHDGVPLIFDINENGAYMLVKITTYLDYTSHDVIRMSEIIDLNIVFLAQNLYIDFGVERCGDTVSLGKGYPTFYMILPKGFHLPSPYRES